VGAELPGFAAAHLPCPEGDIAGAGLAIDETAPRRTAHAPPEWPRQYAGITGQVENCGTTVFCSYVTPAGHCWVDWEPYLPEPWCQDAACRAAARVPEDVRPEDDMLRRLPGPLWLLRSLTAIVGGLDIHRKQITFDYLDTVTGQVRCGQIGRADRTRLRTWLHGGVSTPDRRARWERIAAPQLSAAGQVQVAVAARVLDALEVEIEARRARLVAAAKHLHGATVLRQRVYGVGPIGALAFTCWLAGADRFSSARKAVRFCGLDVTVYSSPR
jgi:hypothetical protein